MLFTELGDRHKPAIMLIGGQKEADIKTNKQIQTLFKEFRVILPEPELREREAETAAKHIYQYVAQNCGGKLYALCGFSDSWEIAQKLLEKYHVDSCKVIVENETSEPGKMIVNTIC